MVKTGSYYFLSRPSFREKFVTVHFGSLFSREEKTFEGLAIEKLEKDHFKYPTLHIDLNTEKYDTPERLENKLNRTLVEWEKIYGAESAETSLAMRFEGIIQRALRKIPECRYSCG